MKKIALLMCIMFIFAVIIAGCAKQFKQTEQTMKHPINCATADADIRSLHHEKAHVRDQIAMGVSAIAPIGLVAGLVTKTEGTKMRVATGKYK